MGYFFVLQLMALSHPLSNMRHSAVSMGTDLGGSSSNGIGGWTRLRGGGSDRTFAAPGHGGEDLDPATTALVMIEYQNEFATEGGKLHDAVKGVMASTQMLQKSVEACDAARAAGALVIHSPILFRSDMTDNPNPNLGILAGVNEGKLFVEGTFGADFVEPMRPREGDLVVTGKKGLDAFPGTDLESLLVKRGIKTIVLAGFLTNCCVESTMRTAYEKGFNVITLTDCTASMSEAAQLASTEGTFGMFSKPMSKDEFLAELKQ
ncbi:Isochorismatase-like protein [Pavlovales sp. CCMP2436]|nr:Isochorismatase-like protein [Pavlovales sp. CCMP2436]|mmetsp:Transcript_21404/g.53272  ORF Transcript_21404/g.53272 Transcript_21404/m.53272 type:complete len:263 (+) Transcript_21404:1-789(+)